MDRRLRTRLPWVVVAAVALLCVVVIGYAGFTSVAAFGPYTGTWEGISELRTMADAGDRSLVVARNASAYGAGSPNATVAFVIAPSNAYDDAAARGIGAFVRAGGTLVVADARNASGNALLAAIGASTRVDGAPLRDETEHGPSPAFPVGTVVSNHSVVDGAETFMLNHGSALETGNASVLVESSSYAYLDRDRDGTLGEMEAPNRRAVIAAERLGQGEVIVVSDPSAVINVMLERADNRAILRNLIGDHERTVLDLSHTGGVPPFMIALLVLRGSIVVQIAVAITALGTVWLGTRDEDVVRRGRARLERLPGVPGRRQPRQAAAPDREQVRAFIEGRRPEWDPERIEQVTGAIRDDQGRD